MEIFAHDRFARILVMELKEAENKEKDARTFQLDLPSSNEEL